MEWEFIFGDRAGKVEKINPNSNYEPKTSNTFSPFFSVSSLAA
jgi:hypothetical protein